jgi:hypothetical protein
MAVLPVSTILKRSNATMSNYDSDLDDGLHKAEIISMNSTKNAKGVPVVEWKLRILGGPHDQLELSKLFHLTTDKVKAFLKKELAMLGVDVSNGQQFLQQKTKCVGKRIYIQAVTNEEGWQSLYLKGIVNEEEDECEEKDDDFDW